MVLESYSDGDLHTTYYVLNDDSTPWAFTPEVVTEFQRVKAMLLILILVALYAKLQAKAVGRHIE